MSPTPLPVAVRTASPGPAAAGVREPVRPHPRATPARRRRGLAALALLLVVVTGASLAVGARPVPLAEVWSALVGPTGTASDVVVRDLRLPRTLVGLAVGAALGLAGALMQAHTRNPLAEPGLLGVSAGAAFAVVLGIQLAGVTATAGLVWWALAGALVASVVVAALGAVAGGRGGPVTLVLAGAVVSAFLVALTSAVVLLDATTLDGYRFWVVGSVAGRDLEVLLAVLPFLVVGAVLATAQAPALDSLALGEDVARGLGRHVGRARLLGLVAVTLLAGGAVAAAGPLGFVGLVVPHVARALTGPDHRWLLPSAALAGAVLVLAADVLGRVVARPGELQTGVVLALVGAPVLVALVRRRRLVGL